MRSRLCPGNVAMMLRVGAVSHFAAHDDARGAALRGEPLDRGGLIAPRVDGGNVEACAGVRIPVAADLRGRCVPEEHDPGRTGLAGVDERGVERARYGRA